MHTCIHDMANPFQGEKKGFLTIICFVGYLNMEILVRKPFFLIFKKVPTSLKLICDDITGSLVLTEPLNKLINLVRIKVDEALLNSMMQFYDPLLHCFTYRDFQLVPILEEFSHIMDIPIPDQIPYTGEEGGPKWEDIVVALHLPRAKINKVWINRRDYSGIPVDFLYEKAKIFAKSLSMDSLESVITLLIYGQVLFHRCDKVVDKAAIKIFLSKNLVPTLLG